MPSIVKNTPAAVPCPRPNKLASHESELAKLETLTKKKLATAAARKKKEEDKKKKEDEEVRINLKKERKEIKEEENKAIEEEDNRICKRMKSTHMETDKTEDGEVNAELFKHDEDTEVDVSNPAYKK